MGFPSPAHDYTEPPIDLIEHLIPDPDATFFYQVETDSMINALVARGSIVVVQRSATPENGSMVIARLNGIDYLRILQKNAYQTRLLPANSKYQPVTITKEMTVEILGVVTYVINSPITWRHVCIG
jgi:DNA polymerase V